jgi:hypothetical protein
MPVFSNQQGQTLLEVIVWISLIVFVVAGLSMGFRVERVRYHSLLRNGLPKGGSANEHAEG